MLAEEAGIREVVVPKSPGTFCALGSLSADFRMDFVQTVNSPLRTPDWPRIRQWYKEKEAEAKSQMQDESSIEGLLAVLAADIRYEGQGFNTEVALTAEVLAAENAQQLAADFVERYAQLYGVSQASVPGEIVNIRLTVIGKRARVRPRREAAADSEVRPSGSRSVYFDGARRTIPVFSREHLGAGARITGPCVIDQSDTTTFVRARVERCRRRTRESTAEPRDKSMNDQATPRRFVPDNSPSTIRTDPIELEIFCKQFAAIAEQMAITIAKTSHTTFVRETQDFGAAMATTGGTFFAYPRTLGASTLLGLPFADCINAIERYEEGDFALTNDPFLSKAGCTHVPDITAWSPVFVNGELLCFTWGFIHSSDMGGAVPGSIAPSLTDTFQEGIRLPPLKLYRSGVLNEDVRAILRNNVRIPDQLWGDIQAIRAGHHVAMRKIQALAERHGVAKLRTVMEDVLTYSELKAREVFKRLPPGANEFADYLEDDTVSEVPIRIQLAMTVEVDAASTSTTPAQIRKLTPRTTFQQRARCIRG